jgi:hypothetical protein
MPQPMLTPIILVLAIVGGCGSTRESAPGNADKDGFQRVFAVEPGEWSSTGRNDWFVLEPGYRLVFENQNKTEALVITVLDETKLVDQVETRVVEERETAHGQLKEVSRNYFAISKRTNDVYYFGEDVEEYEKGVLASNGGSWLSGVDKASYGLMLPAHPLLGAKWYQEQAPAVALDRSEVQSLDKIVSTPAGKFAGCLETLETTPLEPDAREKKYYAPGIGLVVDGSLRLVSYGPQAQKR